MTGATIPVLAALSDKSLIQLEPGGRYAIHPLLQQYIRSKLDEDAAASVRAEEAHARYFLRFLATWGEKLRGGREAEALAALSEEAGNIASAWRTAAANGWWRDLRSTCTALETMYVQRNWFREGIELLQDTVDQIDTAAPHGAAASGVAHVSMGLLYLRSGRLGAAEKAASKGLALLHEADDSAGLAEAHNVLGSAAGKSGRFAEAEEHFEAALRHATELGDRRLAAIYRNNLGIVAKEMGEYEAATDHYRAALAVNREVQNHVSFVRNANNLGNLYLELDRLDEAEAILREGLELARDMGLQQTSPHLLATLASVLVEAGRFEEALACLDEALRTASASGEREVEADAQRSYGKIALARGDIASARRHFLESLEIGRAMQSALAITKAMVLLAEVAVRDGATEYAEELLTVVLGHPAANRATKDQARRVAAELPEGDPRASDVGDAELEGAVSMVLGHDPHVGRG